MCYSLTCPLCQGSNQCALAQTGESKSQCWCMQARIAPEILAKIPRDQLNKACICPNCAAQQAGSAQQTEAAN